MKMSMNELNLRNFDENKNYKKIKMSKTNLYSSLFLYHDILGDGFPRATQLKLKYFFSLFFFRDRYILHKE